MLFNLWFPSKTLFIPSFSIQKSFDLIKICFILVCPLKICLLSHFASESYLSSHFSWQNCCYQFHLFQWKLNIFFSLVGGRSDLQINWFQYNNMINSGYQISVVHGITSSYVGINSACSSMLIFKKFHHKTQQTNKRKQKKCQFKAKQ